MKRTHIQLCNRKVRDFDIDQYGCENVSGPSRMVKRRAVSIVIDEDFNSFLFSTALRLYRLQFSVKFCFLKMIVLRRHV